MWKDRYTKKLQDFDLESESESSESSYSLTSCESLKLTPSTFNHVELSTLVPQVSVPNMDVTQPSLKESIRREVWGSSSSSDDSQSDNESILTRESFGNSKDELSLAEQLRRRNPKLYERMRQRKLFVMPPKALQPVAGGNCI
jgi:hypothetical protein